MPVEPFLDETDWKREAKNLDFISTTTRGFSVHRHFVEQIKKYARQHGHELELGLPTKDKLDDWLSKKWKLMTLAQFGGVRSIEAFNSKVATRYWAKHDQVNDGIMWRDHYVVYRQKDFDKEVRKAERRAHHEKVEARLARVKDKQIQMRGQIAPGEEVTMDQEHTEKRVHASKLATSTE